MSVFDIARKEDRKSRETLKKVEPVKGIKGATKAAVELGVQSAVITTIAPGAAAGVAPVYGAGIPLVVMKGLFDELKGGEAVRANTGRGGCVPDSEDETIVGTAGKISQRYGVTTFMHDMKCDACGTVFPPGTKFRVLSAHLGAVIPCPKCPGVVHAK